MPEDEAPKIIADDDWKAEARAEKERLTDEAKEAEAAEGSEEAPSVFLQLLDLIAQQAIISLGGAQLPNGQTLPANPQAAKLFVDMLGALEVKTKGNLTEEEAEVMNSMLSRLRWAFSMSGSPQPGAGGPPGAPDGSVPDAPPPESPAEPGGTGPS